MRKRRVASGNQREEIGKTASSSEELSGIEEESRAQALPEQKAVFSVSEKIRKRVHNLPDPTHPPLGYDEQKGFERVYPYLRLPVLHPPNHGDTAIFNAPELPADRLVLGDNLEFLRTLKSETIDLIYIDPPFFSGRQYNLIWGDSNEVRTFEDIWEGGLDSYLIWLNARLWEMRRVLKKTGSIYVHCDWHASHYIKAEMDKIFGYENLRNEIVWGYKLGGRPKDGWARKHDIILYYTKSDDFVFNADDVKIPYESTGGYISSGRKIAGGKEYAIDPRGKVPEDWWDIPALNHLEKERIGYPTQKPEALLGRILKASSSGDDMVADFFCGGGTTLAVAMKLGRRFIGCDSSRVAISVTLDRLVKIGEELSGVKSNVSRAEAVQQKLSGTKVPNIEVSYVGTYPVEKFEFLPQDDFVNFVLTAYGASRNTASGVTHGYRPPGQQEPILIGPANSKASIEANAVKVFFDEIKQRLEPNKMVRAKVIGWRFSRRVVEYVKILRRYIEKNIVPLEIELIPLDSKEFRRRVLQRYPEVEEGETLLRFSKAPVIGDVRVKKVGPLEYEFEAIDAFSTNEDGWLVNCQWDFDYQEGHFAADKDYILRREKVRGKKRGAGERFEAVLTAKHAFEKPGEYTIACRVQDNLGGETILSKRTSIQP